MKHFELVSFSLCPFVQRSVITLLRKKVEHKITYIDLASPPIWFQQISPLGKVPLLLVREKEGAEPAVLFESAIINEYIDEVTPPALALADPLRRAEERAWVEVASELQGKVYLMSVAESEAAATAPRDAFFSILSRLEARLPGGEFFRGKSFSLVDSAFAPVFTRLFLLRGLGEDASWAKLPKARAWASSLVALPEVRNSVIANFDDEFRRWSKARGGALV